MGSGGERGGSIGKGAGLEVRALGAAKRCGLPDWARLAAAGLDPAGLAGGAGSGRRRGRTVQQVRGRAERPAGDRAGISTWCSRVCVCACAHLIFDHGLEIMFGFFEKGKIFFGVSKLACWESRDTISSFLQLLPFPSLYL